MFSQDFSFSTIALLIFTLSTNDYIFYYSMNFEYFQVSYTSLWTMENIFYHWISIWRNRRASNFWNYLANNSYLLQSLPLLNVKEPCMHMLFSRKFLVCDLFAKDKQSDILSFFLSYLLRIYMKQSNILLNLNKIHSVFIFFLIQFSHFSLLYLFKDNFWLDQWS